MNATCHLVSRDPMDGRGFESCLDLAASGDAVVLMGAAAAAAGLADLFVKTGVSFFVLDSDLAQHGIESDTLPPGISVIDMDGLVELTTTCPRSQSW